MATVPPSGVRSSAGCVQACQKQARPAERAAFPKCLVLLRKLDYLGNCVAVIDSWTHAVYHSHLGLFQLGLAGPEQPPEFSAGIGKHVSFSICHAGASQRSCQSKSQTYPPIFWPLLVEIWHSADSPRQLCLRLPACEGHRKRLLGGPHSSFTRKKATTRPYQTVRPSTRHKLSRQLRQSL